MSEYAQIVGDTGTTGIPSGPTLRERIEQLEQEIASLKVERKLLWSVTHGLEARLKKIEDAGGVVVHSHVHINSASIEDEVRKALRKGALSSSLADTLLLDDVTPAITH